MTELHQISFEPLSAATLAQQAADRIVDAIARGEIKGGQRLIEHELASALGISRLPVREGLRSLVDQGLLVPLPKRGLRVITFDGEWARQLCAIRIHLELACAQLVRSRLKQDPALGRALLAPIETMRECASRLDHLAFNRSDIAFHSALYALAGNPLLSAIWAGISRHVLILFSIETADFNSFDRTVEDHQRYVAVLLSGDVAKTEEAIHDHFTEFRLLAESADSKSGALNQAKPKVTANKYTNR